MKRLSLLLIAILMVLVLNNMVFAENNQVYQWKLQTATLLPTEETKITLPAYCDRVRERSNGRLDITLYSAGDLVPSVEIADALRVGMIDMAYAWANYFVGIIPETNLDIGSIPPLIFESVEDVWMLYWLGGLDDIMRKGFADYGIEYLGSLFDNTPIAFWSRYPMYSIEDVKGFKIRYYGYHAKVFEKLGATPVFLPHEEVYTSLSQGVIDGSATNAKNYKDQKLYEVAPYFYELPDFYSPNYGSFMVSKKSWDALPDDLKAIVKEEMFNLMIDNNYRSSLTYKRMLEDFDDLNVTTIRWSEEDAKKMREISISILPEIAAKSESTKEGIEIIMDYLRERGYLGE